MEDEYDRIMAFFSLSPEEKEERLHEVFEDSVEYFERFKHIMVNGTPEEKKAAAEKVMLLRKCIEAETKKVCERTGLTEEQLQQQTMKQENFSDSQWHTIEGAKRKLEKGVDEIREITQGKEGSSEKPKPKKKSKKPKKWIQS